MMHRAAVAIVCRRLGNPLSGALLCAQDDDGQSRSPESRPRGVLISRRSSSLS